MGGGLEVGEREEEAKEDTVLSPPLASYYLKLFAESTSKYEPTKFGVSCFLLITVDHVLMHRIVNNMDRVFFITCVTLQKHVSAFSESVKLRLLVDF